VTLEGPRTAVNDVGIVPTGKFHGSIKGISVESKRNKNIGKLTGCYRIRILW
jgi:hypothetical protein